MPPFELASVQNAKMGLAFDVRSRLRFNNYEGSVYQGQVVLATRTFRYCALYLVSKAIIHLVPCFQDCKNSKICSLPQSPKLLCTRPLDCYRLETFSYG